MVENGTHSSGGNEWYFSSSSELISVIVDSIFNIGLVASTGATEKLSLSVKTLKLNRNSKHTKWKL